MTLNSNSPVFISHPYRGSEGRILARWLDLQLHYEGISSKYDREGILLESKRRIEWRSSVTVFLISTDSSSRSFKILTELQDEVAGTSNSVIVIETADFIPRSALTIVDEERAYGLLERIQYLLSLSKTTISSLEVKKQYRLRFGDDYLVKNPESEYILKESKTLTPFPRDGGVELKKNESLGSIPYDNTQLEEITNEAKGPIKIHSKYGLIQRFKEQFLNSSKLSKRVDFSVFVTSKPTDRSFTIDLWAHFKEDFEYVSKSAELVDQDKLIGTKKGVSLEFGTEITAELQVDFLQVKEALGSLEWNGEATNLSFICSRPNNMKYPEEALGKVVISSYGMMIANIPFILDFRSNVPTLSSEATEYTRSAFASYSSKNRIDVLERIQGMKVVAPDLDIFFDIFSLRTGQNWEEALKEHVPSKDIFYLFWSSDAANSKWVAREWHMALDKRGLDYITPIPLEDLDRAPPPKELDRLHFRNTDFDHIQLERMKRRG